MTVAWVDCSAGVSGDMLLGALADLGALDGLAPALESLPGLQASYVAARTDRGSLAATHVRVDAPAQQPPRRLVDLLLLVDHAAVPAPVRAQARAVLERLARAEGRVHGVEPEDVHFHEIGAVDTVVDVVGVCLGVHALGVDRLVAGPVALGSGTVDTSHGRLPVPTPAVVQLLAGSSLVATGGADDGELATPTGVALLAELAEPGPMPTMSVSAVGVGAGSRDRPDRPNVVRIIVGASAAAADGGWLLIEANVDDLDPRVWPAVLEALLAAGAADAWLTPILMKKGRPAHTVAALAPAGAEGAVRRALVRESSTIGVRTTAVGKHALDRSWVDVCVDGQPVRVKVARDAGSVVNVSPEWDDVAAAAQVLGRPAKSVLAAATAAAAAAAVSMLG